MFKILLPTDFSENSRRAIDFVLDHFTDKDIQLLLIHTIKAPHSAAGVLIRIDDLMQKDAERDMNDLMDYVKNKRPDVKLDSILKLGHLKDWVQQYAKTYGVNMIAMGTKGENNITSRLLGSVTESVIRTSKIPLLAIPNIPAVENINNVAIATAEQELEKEEFLVDFFNNIKMLNPSIKAVKVIKDHSAGSARAIALAGNSVNVELVENESVVDGINGYIDVNHPDILIIFHKRNSKFDYFFNRSITKNICGRTSVPLLVIPSA